MEGSGQVFGVTLDRFQDLELKFGRSFAHVVKMGRHWRGECTFFAVLLDGFKVFIHSTSQLSFGFSHILTFTFQTSDQVNDVCGLTRDITQYFGCVVDFKKG